MPDTNDRVRAMVEKELQANPDVSNKDLRAKAEKIDDSVASMSARQFNATYPLQVKRKLQPRKARKARKGAKRAAGGRKAGRKSAAGSGGGAKRGGKRGRPAGSGRKPGRPAGSGSRGAGGTDATRGRVRAALLDFARDLASADGAGLVDVIAGVDDYVDRVMKATGTR